MLLTKFIYDLSGRPEPKDEDLDDEIDRLLCMKSTEEPNHVVQTKDLDQNHQLDTEVLSYWLRRRFEPALILLLLSHEDNYKKARAELAKMERYQPHWVEKFLRAQFVDRRATERLKALCFDESDDLQLTKVVLKIKKTLTFLSKRLDGHNNGGGAALTLQGTDAYTTADIALYNYLKRLLVGKYKDCGLKSHVKLCEPLINFMSQYARLNTHVINVCNDDPIADPNEGSSLLQDVTKCATIAIGFILFFVWRSGR